MARAVTAVETAAGLAVLRVEGTLRDALAPEVLGRLTTEELARFLGERRWFGAKGGAPRRVRFASVIPLAWDDGSFAIARLDVETDDGAHHQYQLPLAVRERGAPAAVLARVDSPGGDGLLFDAVEDAAFRRHLADAFARGARFEAGRSRWVVEPISAQALVVPLEAPIELGTAQQSNTSIRFGEEGILKVFRKIEPGENPDVEISRFLTTRANFPYTPALFGVSRFEDGDASSGRAETTVSGMLQEFLPGAVDGWSYAVERGRAEGGGGRGEPAQRSPTTCLPPPTFFGADARRLGGVTRALHAALASAGPEEVEFVPEKATAADVASWARATEKQIDDALALLERQLAAARLPAEFVEEARALVGRRGESLKRVRELADAVRGDAGLRIRHHGDYHLGQVLRTAAGEFMIIDFEGEPARPLAERRRKHSALRDVAGMLRSFAYAGAAIADGGRRAAGGGDGTTQWEREAREAFLTGYFEGREKREEERGMKLSVGFLPMDSENVRRLLELFETEKVFYELAYELNNRPDWVWIPMRALG